MLCDICGIDSKVVRDHNHKTKFIRGKLCEPCNSMLGLYESTKITKHKLSKKYLGWISKHELAIKAYLDKGDINIRYSGKRGMYEMQMRMLLEIRT